MRFPHSPYRHPYTHDYRVSGSEGFVSGAAYALGEMNKVANTKNWNNLKNTHDEEHRIAFHKSYAAQSLATSTEDEISRKKAEEVELNNQYHQHVTELRECEQTLQNIHNQIAQLTVKNNSLMHFP